MAIITEDYVSFEVAKLLKEKGFDTPVWTRYENDDNNEVVFGDKYNWNNSPMGQISAPTLQMAMKWLRAHNIFISIVCCTYPTLNKATWTSDITTFESVFPDSAVECDTYEEACETAIKYCLENLI